MPIRTIKNASFALAIAVAGPCFAQTTSQAQTASATPALQPAAAPEIKLDTSVIYARGSYGLPTDTDIWMAQVSPTYETTDYRLQLAVPYIWLKGPASAAGGVGATAASRSESGVGDVSVTGTWKLAPTDGWYTSVGAKVKFPTADDAKGLGTGQTDAAFQFDAAKKFGDLTPYATVGYQFLGRSALYPMKDGAFATVGVISPISDQAMFGIGGNWRQPTFTGGKSAEELMLFIQQKMSGSSHFQIFALHGFTDASPSFALGATLGWKW